MFSRNSDEIRKIVQEATDTLWSIRNSLVNTLRQPDPQGVRLRIAVEAILTDQKGGLMHSYLLLRHVLHIEEELSLMIERIKQKL